MDNWGLRLIETNEKKKNEKKQKREDLEIEMIEIRDKFW